MISFMEQIQGIEKRRKARPYDFRVHYAYGLLLLDLYLYGRVFETFKGNKDRILLRKARRSFDIAMRMAPERHFLQPRIAKSWLIVHVFESKGQRKAYERILLSLRLRWRTGFRGETSDVLSEFRQHLLAVDARRFHSSGYYSLKNTYSELPSLLLLLEDSRKNDFEFQILQFPITLERKSFPAMDVRLVDAASRYRGWGILWLLFFLKYAPESSHGNQILLKGMHIPYFRLHERFAAPTKWTNSLDSTEFVERIDRRVICPLPTRIHFFEDYLVTRSQRPLEYGRILANYLDDPRRDQIEERTHFLDSCGYLPDLRSASRILLHEAIGFEKLNIRMKRYVRMILTLEPEMATESFRGETVRREALMDVKGDEESFLAEFLSSPIFNESAVERAIGLLSRLEGDKRILLMLRLTHIRALSLKPLKNVRDLPEIMPIQFTYDTLQPVAGTGSLYRKDQTNLYFLPKPPQFILLPGIAMAFRFQEMEVDRFDRLDRIRPRLSVPYQDLLSLAEASLVRLAKEDPPLASMVLGALLEPLMSQVQTGRLQLDESTLERAIPLLASVENLMLRESFGSVLKQLSHLVPQDRPIQAILRREAQRIHVRRMETFGEDQSVADRRHQLAQFLQESMEYLPQDDSFKDFVTSCRKYDFFTDSLAQSCIQCLKRTCLYMPYGSFLETFFDRLEEKDQKDPELNAILDAVGSDIQNRLKRHRAMNDFSAGFASTVKHWYGKSESIDDEIRSCIYQMINQSNYSVDKRMLEIMLDIYRKNPSRILLLHAIVTQAIRFGVPIPPEWVKSSQKR
jgi:hypothetical protein